MRLRGAATAALILSALFVAWVAIQAAVVEELGGRAPRVAAAVAPEDPRPAFAMAAPQLGLYPRRAEPVLEQAALDAFARAPLAHHPFTIAAVAALERGDIAQARGLLEEARRREPRARLPRLLLLNLQLSARDVPGATAEMIVLSRLMPDLAQALIPELAQRAQNPETLETLAQALDSDPQMKATVLLHLARGGADPDLLLRLAGPVAPGGGEAWQQALVENLVEREQYARARNLWERVAGVPAAGATGLVYDGNFRGAPGAPPFNWSYAAGSNGSAERDSGGLQVSYFGGTQTELARQLLLLPPGRYRLATQAQVESGEGGGRLVWRIACVGGTENVAEQGLAAASPGGDSATSFAIPSGCPAQWLTLVGLPGEFARPQQATVTSVAVESGR